MLLRSDVLGRIRDGHVSLAFRRWRRPSVRSGGTLLTSIGRLQIASVSTASEETITEDDARRAGYTSLDDLLHELNRRPEGVIYRVEFNGIEPDPRVEVRESIPDDAELTTILQQLNQLDGRSPDGPWTRPVLELVANRPGVLAESLALQLGTEKLPFKSRVRKLKALGLTVSLDTGYRLSPRGESVLERIVRTSDPDSTP
jgi:hypothetical protein